MWIKLVCRPQYGYLCKTRYIYFRLPLNYDQTAAHYKDRIKPKHSYGGANILFFFCVLGSRADPGQKKMWISVHFALQYQQFFCIVFDVILHPITWTSSQQLLYSTLPLRFMVTKHLNHQHTTDDGHTCLPPYIQSGQVIHIQKWKKRRQYFTLSDTIGNKKRASKRIVRATVTCIV